MKLLFFVFISIFSSLQAQSLLNDNFESSALNGSLWDTFTSPLTPAGTSGAVYLSNGNLVLVNRGTIITKQGFNTPFDLNSNFRIEGNYDRVGIYLRTTGASTNPWKDQDNGIFINFQQDTYGDFSKRWIGIAEWSVGGLNDLTGAYTNDSNTYYNQLATTPANIPSNTLLNYRITDDGYNIAVYLENLSTPILTASTSFAPGNKIAFNNGYSGNQIAIDSVEIIPETSAVSLLDVGLGVLFRRSRKKD